MHKRGCPKSIFNINFFGYLSEFEFKYSTLKDEYVTFETASFRKESILIFLTLILVLGNPGNTINGQIQFHIAGHLNRITISTSGSCWGWNT